jgi:hypothetical protein
VHDAWAPHDYTRATHAPCNAHVLRELVYVTDTATGQVADLAEQAIGALQQLNRLVTATRTDGSEPDQTDIGQQRHLLRSAVVLGAETTANRADKLQRKHHALFARSHGSPLSPKTTCTLPRTESSGTYPVTTHQRPFESSGQNQERPPALEACAAPR